MTRNTESHFSLAPQIEVRRSKFNRNSRTLTTFNVGELTPIYLDEVLPGDTFKLKTSKLVRMTTSVHPTMDNAYLDTYFFYVPIRLLWDHWEQFNGASESAWIQPKEYTIPIFNLMSEPNEPNSLLDHLGIPTTKNTTTYNRTTKNILPVRAYMKICNDWFRDENLEDEIPYTTNDNTTIWNPANTTKAYKINGKYPYQNGSLFKAAKFHDYFTSALPGPQKHADVYLPINGDIALKQLGASPASMAPYFQNYQGTLAQGTITGQSQSSTGVINAENTGTGTSNNNLIFFNPNGSLELQGVQVTVNQLRLLVQTQRLFERDARGGTRYNEILKAHFGVTSPDARLQRSEYLGGKQIPINMTAIAQTSATGTDTTALGSLAGNSATSDVEDGFIKSFVEHGYIIGLAVVRTEQSYSQGIHKLWSRKDRLDFYWPVLGNIGEQPILNQEIYYNPGLSDQNENINTQVFGYQEAWAEYRYKPNMITGYFRPGITESLDSWHYGIEFNSTPVLSKAFIEQDVNEVDRTLAITSDIAPQIIGDFYFNCVCVRPMPVYSVPGALDHF